MGDGSPVKGEANGTERVQISGTTLSTVIPAILEDCLYNVIHDLILSAHRSEKLLRMQSAAVHAENEACKAVGVAPPTPATSDTPSKIATSFQAAPQTTIETHAAKYESGRVSLKGNPLKVMKEIYCPQCKLPRLLFPLTGENSKLPDKLDGQYCALQPFIQKSGFDIYGNPFPIDTTGKTKKEKELIKKAERAEKDNTPGSQGTNDDGTITEEAALKKLMVRGKGASYVPWHTCPQCKRSLYITKFAQHLEKCLGIGGRTARNVAAARLSGVNGSVDGSVAGSRMGTPTPSLLSGKRDALDDDDLDDERPKKKMKRDFNMKKDKKDKERSREKERDRDGDETPVKKEKVILKLGKPKTSDAGSRGPKRKEDSATPAASSKGDDGGGGGSSKRERSESVADRPNKKQKTQRQPEPSIPDSD